ADAYDGVVGVAGREAEAGEVLRGRERVRLREPERKRARESGRLRGVERPGPALPVHEPGPRSGPVGDGCQVDVDAESTQGRAGAAPLVERAADRACPGRRYGRRDPR